MAACVLLMAGLVPGQAVAGAAAPKPTEKELKAQLASLTKKIDKLIAEYNAKRVAVGKAKAAEKAARDRLKSAEAAYALAQSQVRDIAQLRYQAGGLGLVGELMSPGYGGAAMFEQLQAEQSARLSGFASARDTRKQAAGDAEKLTAELRDDMTEVSGQRKDAEKLIDEIKDKLDKLIPTAPGKRANGAWAPELPTGSDNITPRTRLMRAEVRSHFTLRFPVGCYRAETSGEHPLGRACDFMLSSGGALPAAGDAALGNEIAAWIIKNGGKLGVKYVIYRQRIYNLGFPGWRPMSDRGGVTANHFDHVHISMY
ncbi:coiled-coil domain-containing protein [Sphaerisporangium aureirubrum]|uniref:Coiled-coil domain-containing protein n=1 Tax=Sphaerisporangium aureirubrum TaxID=1544736 RepID=A0ABW1NNJ8_9ACTN